MANVTRDQILEIVGHGRLDDQVLGEIIATNATEQDVIAALDWAVRGGEMGAETQHALNYPASAVYDLLVAAAEDWSQEDEAR
jgi:hypothetical protein